MFFLRVDDAPELHGREDGRQVDNEDDDHKHGVQDEVAPVRDEAKRCSTYYSCPRPWLSYPEFRPMTHGYYVNLALLYTLRRGQHTKLFFPRVLVISRAWRM